MISLLITPRCYLQPRLHPRSLTCVCNWLLNISARMPKKHSTLNTSQTELLVPPKGGSSASLSQKVAPPPSKRSSLTAAFLSPSTHNPKQNTSDLTSKTSSMQNTTTASCVHCEIPHPSQYHPQSSAPTSPPSGLPALHPTHPLFSLSWAQQPGWRC